MLDRRRSGDAIAASALDLARVWRSACAAERADRFPGLLDDLVEPFFSLVGEALAEGRDAALVWPAATGVVRVYARDDPRTRAELDVEWDVAEQVLQAACRALAASDGVSEWISRVISTTREGCRALLEGAGPRGVLVVRAF